MSIIDTSLPEDVERRRLEYEIEKKELESLHAELRRLRAIEADATRLRRAFEVAAKAYFKAMQGKSRDEWKGEPREVWQSLYEAVRDSRAGLTT